MNRRDLIKKGAGLGIAATGMFGLISSRSRADTAGALEKLDALIDLVAELNAKEGIINSLDAKLAAALQAFDDINANNDVAAINSMEAFIGAVEAQRGKHITDAEANSLIAAANNVIYELSDPGCEVPPCGGGGGGTGV